MSEELPLGEFITRPDTVPLITRTGSYSNEEFRRNHNIRRGTTLTGDYNIEYVDRSELEDIVAETGVNMISLFPVALGLLDQHDLDASGIIQVQRQPYLDLRGRGVMVGIVDTGIDYTQEAFQYEDGTSKIEYIWDQTISGNAPKGFHFGAEFSNEQINEALQSDNPYDVVPHRDTAGHGTFLASVAASREEGDYIGAAPDADIIAVKLRKAPPFFYERYMIPESQENAFIASDVMLGIQFMLIKAQQLGKPIAICVALGSNQGGHDGFEIMEEYLNRISNIPGVAVVCAAGNESQAKHHTQGRLQSRGESQNIEISTVNQDQDIYMTIWNGASDRMSVSLKSPTGEMIPNLPVRAGASYTTSLVFENSRVSIEYFLPLEGSGGQLTRIKIFRPTPGIWTVTVLGEIILDGTFHSWLPLTGFIDPDTVFLSPTPNFTIVTPGASIGVITSGAYDSKTNSLYINSSWGPTRLPTMEPDLVAPGSDVGGIYPGGYGKMNGTSVAAAITAGACALMLQWGIVDRNEVTMTTNRIRAHLIRGCDRDSSMEYPNVQWGYGRLNLYNSLNLLRTL